MLGLPRFLHIALFVACLSPGASLAQNTTGVGSIDPAQLMRFLRAHRGPVLDVRMQNDCSDAQSLQRTTARIGFDFGPDTPDGKKIARDMFMSKVNTTNGLLAAKGAGQSILVVCCAGGRSEAAAQLLTKHGFKVSHVPGGLTHEKVPAQILKSN